MDVSSNDLAETERKIRVMSVTLNRLVSDGDKHTWIPELKPLRIVVIPQLLMTFKILCFERLAPCTINIKYEGRSNLEVYVSQIHTEPNEKKFE